MALDDLYFEEDLLPEEDGDNAINIAKITIALLVCTLGLLANIVVISSILILKEYKKSVTHWYVLQLAIADALFLFCLPFQASEWLNDMWIYSEWMCKAKETIYFFNFYASILFLMVMSIDRYAAICLIFTDIFHTLRKKKSAFIISSFVWGVSLLLTIPVMLFSSTNNVECICTSVFPEQRDTAAFCMEQGIEDNLELCEFIIASSSNENACRKRDSTMQPTLPDFPSGFGEECNERALFPELNNGGSNLYDVEFLNPLNQSHGFNLLNNFNGTESTEVSEIDIPDEADLFGGNNVTGDYIAPPFDRSDLLSQSCDYINEPPAWTAFIAFNFSVMFLLPFLVMCVFYGLIAYTMETTKVNSANRRNHRERRRVSIMCASLAISFMIFWTPFYAVNLAKLEGIPAELDHVDELLEQQYKRLHDKGNAKNLPKGRTCEIITTVALLLRFLAPAVNPYLYSCLGPGIKRRWKTLKSSRTVQNFLKTTRQRQGLQGIEMQDSHNRHRKKESSLPKSHTSLAVTKDSPILSKGNPFPSKESSERGSPTPSKKSPV